MAVLSKLSRYRDISTLGSGGMATVVLAQDTLLGREVALKRMHTAADPHGASRLRREALVGASISHANLVSIYDVVTTDDGDVVIVMEYVDGENLRDALRRQGQLPIGETLRVLEGVAAGLDAIHQQGIVHRDVKPANILLGANGSVKLADLGIAAVPDRTRITSAGTVLGSFSYMAPEQLEDAPATPAIDIYALAAVAYEALSGTQAHRESTPIAVAHAIATQPPPDLRNVWAAAPPAAADLLLRAMTRDPAQRPRSAGELVARLRAALTSQDTQRLPAAPVPAPRPAPSRARAPLAAAGAAGVAGAAAGGALGSAAQAAAAEAPRAPRRQPARADAGRGRPNGAPPPPAPPGARRTARAVVPLALLAAIGVVAAILLSGGNGKSPGAGTNASHTGGSTKRASSPPRRATTSTRSHTPTTSTAPATRATPTTSSASSPTTSTPSTTAASTPTPTGATGSPTAAVSSFYELAAAHNYPQAWSLADPVFRNQLGGYDSFKSGQAADKAIIFHKDQVISQSGHTATVAVQTTSERTNGTQHCQGTVQVQNASGGWLLHAISINCT